MQVVFADEAASPKATPPRMINLVSLRKLAPHFHRHNVPRFTEGRHCPARFLIMPQRKRTAVPGTPDTGVPA